MKSLVSGIVAALALTASVQTCFAADSNGYFNTMGAPSCGEFVLGQQPGHDLAGIRAAAWIGGYVSAYNTWMPDTYDILAHAGIDGVTVWMTNYCNAHPLESLSKAMEKLVAEQQPKRDVARRR